MKKVLLLTVALAILAAPAFAAISGSKHDFRSGSGNAVVDTINNDQTCIYCHTPHNGDTAVGFLWNRNGLPAAFAAGDLYTSGSLSTDSAPATVLANVNGSDARLCLSCHDGALTLSGQLRNPAGDLTTDNTVFNPVNLGGRYSNLGATLLNDHPIGMDYTAVDTTGPKAAQFNDISASALPLYGAGSNVMWCSTCHDPHSSIASMLVIANTGSALCTTCHIK